jgi:hypothetical protein
MRWSVRTSSQVMSVYQWKSACWDKPDCTRSHRIPLLKKINKREYIDIKMIPNNTIINYLHVILKFLLWSVRFSFLATTYSSERWTAAFSYEQLDDGMGAFLQVPNIWLHIYCIGSTKIKSRVICTHWLIKLTRLQKKKTCSSSLTQCEFYSPVTMPFLSSDFNCFCPFVMVYARWNIFMEY